MGGIHRKRDERGNVLVGSSHGRRVEKGIKENNNSSQSTLTISPLSIDSHSPNVKNTLDLYSTIVSDSLDR